MQYNFIKIIVMKKIILLLLVALFGLSSMYAQNWYLGGSLGIRTYSDANSGQLSSTFSIIPEVGYNLNDKWMIGLQIGFGADSYKDSSTSTSFLFNPYARWTFYRIKDLSLFGDMGLTYQSSGVSNAKKNTYYIGVEPGLAYDINKSFSLVAHLGFIGFIGGDDKSINGFNLSANNNLSFGFYYRF